MQPAAMEKEGGDRSDSAEAKGVIGIKGKELDPGFKSGVEAYDADKEDHGGQPPSGPGSGAQGWRILFHRQSQESENIFPAFGRSVVFPGPGLPLSLGIEFDFGQGFGCTELGFIRIQRAVGLWKPFEFIRIEPEDTTLLTAIQLYPGFRNGENPHRLEAERATTGTGLRHGVQTPIKRSVEVILQ